MCRVRKFRAWDNGSPIYGTIGDIGFSKFVAYDSDTVVEQFVNLTDINEVDIYEGDKLGGGIPDGIVRFGEFDNEKKLC